MNLKSNLSKSCVRENRKKDRQAKKVREREKPCQKEKEKDKDRERQRETGGDRKLSAFTGQYNNH